MKDADVAIRYARALFEATDQRGESGQARSALSKVSQWFKVDPELPKLFLNPALPYAAKEKAIQKILPPRSPSLLGNFLRLLVRNKRLDLLHLITRHFDRIADASEGLARASIRSPQALSESQRHVVIEALTRAVGRRVVGEFMEDSQLIGGIVFCVGDKVIDFSVSGQLSRLKETLG